MLVIFADFCWKPPEFTHLALTYHLSGPNVACTQKIGPEMGVWATSLQLTARKTNLENCCLVGFLSLSFWGGNLGGLFFRRNRDGEMGWQVGWKPLFLKRSLSEKKTNQRTDVLMVFEKEPEIRKGFYVRYPIHPNSISLNYGNISILSWRRDIHIIVLFSLFPNVPANDDVHLYSGERWEWNWFGHCSSATNMDQQRLPKTRFIYSFNWLVGGWTLVKLDIFPKNRGEPTIIQYLKPPLRLSTQYIGTQLLVDLFNLLTWDESGWTTLR